MQDEPDAGLAKPETPLKRGWTTGACATAATKSALHALLSGEFLDPVTITLPKGEQPAFPLVLEKRSENSATAGIIKDAGDDPDVTHGATIIATVRFGQPASGIRFVAGEGVGTITKAGLPIPVGEPAINPVPRDLMSAVVNELCATKGIAPAVNAPAAQPNQRRDLAACGNSRASI